MNLCLSSGLSVFFLRFGTKQIVASVTHWCKSRTSVRRRATLNGETEKYNGMALVYFLFLREIDFFLKTGLGLSNSTFGTK